jgi:hypothetical protein
MAAITKRTGGQEAMGLIGVDVLPANPKKPELKPVQVRALVDIGASTLCIPEHVRIQLELE